MLGILVKNPSVFDHIKIKKLHPTFAAEISGVDFSKPLSSEVFQEVRAAIAKVSTQGPQHAIQAV